MWWEGLRIRLLLQVLSISPGFETPPSMLAVPPFLVYPFLRPAHLLGTPPAPFPPAPNTCCVAKAVVGTDLPLRLCTSPRHTTTPR